MTTVIEDILALNRLTFEAGDEYNSEARLRDGVTSGALQVFTEPRRLTVANPLKAYLILRIDKRVIRVERIAVAMAYRNNGLAQTLILRGRRWRDRHYPAVPIWTYVNAENVASLNAHVHAGFGIEAIAGEWVWIMG